ncbi:MAG: RAMP superfamily CRISPR-associated protein [Methanosarcinales archaeon]
MIYTTYEIIINPKSSFLTKFQSDTIFGHLCWAIRYLHGEDELLEFLGKYKKEPPILVSNGFASGRMPRPIRQNLKRDEVDELIKEVYGSKSNENLRKGLTALKKIKKSNVVDLEVFNAIISGLSEKEFIKKCLNAEICPKVMKHTTSDMQCPLVDKKAKCPAVSDRTKCPILNDDKKDINEIKIKNPSSPVSTVYKNTINRLTSQTKKEGDLFFLNETYYRDDSSISIFAKISEEYDVVYLKELFKFMEYGGFGKRKSTGKGHFVIKDIKELQFKSPENPNAFVTLSNYVPNANDSTDGYYDVIIKRGKLGGHYATCDRKEPFKKPLRMFTAGSVFKVSEYKEYYGCLVPNIHEEDNKIVQYGYAFPVGMIL